MEVTRDLFLSLYDSKIEMIKRNKSVVNPKTGCDDTTEVVVASNIPCGINYSNVPLLDSTGILTVARDSTLYCSDLVDIQKGDVIVINKIEYKAQLPTKYEGYHQEVIIKQKEG